MADNPNDSNDIIPSNEKTSKEIREDVLPTPASEKYPYYPRAEYYEAEASNLELLIASLKKEISKELQDEIKQLEYLVSQTEAENARLKLQVKQLEAEKQQLIQRLENQARFESIQSPKQRAIEEDYDEEFESNLANTELPDGTSGLDKQRGGQPGQVHNPSGKGGFADATKINRSQYQGDLLPLGESNENLIWNPAKNEYEISAGDNTGLKFTYFSVEAAYLNDGFINPNYSNLYSQTILRKQVWYERTPHNRLNDGVGEQYGGRVPLQVLRDMLNSRVNTAYMMPNGQLAENQDFSKAYKNWRMTYQVGTYYKNSRGDLYAILDVNIHESKGNPPSYRTDGNIKSKNYGQRIATTPEERAKWSNPLSKGKGSKKSRK